MRYTIVLYRPDCEDYCRGCRMGGSGWDFEIHSEESADEAAARIAAKRFVNFEERNNRELADWEIHLLIDGFGEHEDGDNDKARGEVCGAAEIKLQDLIAAKAAKAADEQRRLDEAAEKARIAKEEAKDRHERAEFVRLLQKFGTP